MFLALPPDETKSLEKFAQYKKNDYSEQELKNLERTNWFANNERGYQRIQETKPVTLGYALHDSPVGMLAWFVGKLKAWTDNYPWTKDELIHWAFIHYQGSPSAAMQIYKEAEAVLNSNPDSMLGKYISQPVGGSVFPKELWISPREWMEEACNIQFWKQHDKGGHFIAWERPEALAEDVGEFYGFLIYFSGFASKALITDALFPLKVRFPLSAFISTPKAIVMCAKMQKTTAESRRLRKLEYDRKSQRLARERTKGRIAQLETMVENLRRADSNARVASLMDQLDSIIRHHIGDSAISEPASDTRPELSTNASTRRSSSFTLEEPAGQTTATGVSLEMSDSTILEAPMNPPPTNLFAYDDWYHSASDTQYPTIVGIDNSVFQPNLDCFVQTYTGLQ
ncbi:epoxide hydrolase [Fusarium sporotrichioides]|uniref:Epoxide hydrolase n=1 Tax=Fusarium sporotrichioides TaxID=5514 RepID=A0A395S1M6_FUSSP|nr:epoxide hydrolase [Fusarium sporotrichioides]